MARWPSLYRSWPDGYGSTSHQTIASMSTQFSEKKTSFSTTLNKNKFDDIRPTCTRCISYRIFQQNEEHPCYKKTSSPPKQISEKKKKTSCWFQLNPFEKSISQLGSFPQVGANIKKAFETTSQTDIGADFPSFCPSYGIRSIWEETGTPVVMAGIHILNTNNELFYVFLPGWWGMRGPKWFQLKNKRCWGNYRS